MKTTKGHLITNADGCLYIQIGSKVYQEMENGKRVFLFRIKVSWIYRVLIKFRIFQRLFRSDIRAAIIFDKKLFCALKGELYSLNLESGEYKKELQYRSGMKSPLVFTKIVGIRGFDDQLCFGEYYSNPNRNEVNIWSYKKGKWNIVYSFGCGTIRHIHGIVVDKYRDCVYVLTGDSDSECAVWKAKNNFEELDFFWGGDQQSRCCVLQPRENYILYVTDSEYEQNKVYRVEISNEKYMGRCAIHDISGSVIRGYIADDKNLYFSTTVEPDKGGIYSKECIVYRLDQDLKLKKVISDKKDLLNMIYFQYGTADILKNRGKLYIGFTATEKYDGTIIEMEDKYNG